MALKTADGRDIAQEEWRIIPEFPKYRITADGDVRNRKSGQLLNESQNKSTKAYSYHLWKDMPDGSKKSFARNYKSLVYDAFPELKPEPKPEKKRAERIYKKRGSDVWADIPGFPRHQISSEGRIRYKKNREIIEPKIDPETQTKTIVLPTMHNINDLFALAFPLALAQEEAA